MQEGYFGTASVRGAAAGAGGSVILAGSVYGNWSGIHQGVEDYAIVKLDSEGNREWALQVTNSGRDSWH